jgi:hypothetical protein
MRRLLVQFDPTTHRRLREKAFREERSMASLVRELVAKGLDERGAREKPVRVSQCLAVRAGRSKPAAGFAVSEKHDAALAAVFKK